MHGYVFRRWPLEKPGLGRQIGSGFVNDIEVRADDLLTTHTQQAKVGSGVTISNSP